MDAEADNGWRSEQEIKNEEIGKPVTTVGFLVRKPSKGFPMYMIASTISLDEGDGTWQHNNIMKIPKQWVKSLREIKDDRPEHQPEES